MHTVYVVNSEDDVILGLDFLRKYHCIIDPSNNVLRIGHEDVTMENHTQYYNVRCQLVSASTLEVPPMSEILVPAFCATSPPKKLMIVEPQLLDSCAPGLLVARAVMQVDEKETVLRVMNIATTPRTISKDTVLALCEPVDTVGLIRARDDSCKSTNFSKVPIHLQDLFLRASEHLQFDQKEKLRNLLHDFQDVFCTKQGDIGRCKLAKHRIDVGDTQPIKQPPRRLPVSRRQEAADLVKNMERDGIIEPSTSPWTSPVVLVKKKDGSTRFCVDYRRLNGVTKKDSYPLPRIDDTLDAVSGSQWYSTMDLQSGYWQVEMDPRDKEKTAFTTGSGLWQFRVMPFGLCNAPATFERLMELVLHGLSWDRCLVYLDDIIVHHANFEGELENIRLVLTRLRDAGLKVAPKKCHLFQRKVRYLGHIISSNGVHTDPEKIAAVREWPIPQRKHDIRSFLGLCTYYRRFVRDFAKIAKPLHRLTEDKSLFIWTEECDAAFNMLKNRLTTAPILAYPTENGQFTLDTDASQFGIGGVLSQLQQGEERVIGYFSKTLGKPEQNYCVTRKELLGAVKSIEHYHHYLYGRKFLLRTDHAALRWLMSFREPEGQVARWLERLQLYDFEIIHRSGKIHGNADGLSRRPCADNDCKHCDKLDVTQIALMPIVEKSVARTTVECDENSSSWSVDDLRRIQEEDNDLRPIIQWIKEGKRPDWQTVAPYSATVKAYWALWDTLLLDRGVLFRQWESPDGGRIHLQLILPKVRIPIVLQELHNSLTGGHYGINKTLAKVRQRYYWVRSRTDVENWCKQCKECTSKKGPTTRSRGSLQQYNVGAPFERIGIDVLGPLPRTTNGNKYVLVAMDYFTKWPEAIPIPNQEAVTVAEALLTHVVSRHGVPLELHSDQGRNFESAVFTEMLIRLGINKTRTTPLHPQSDGMVERSNRTIMQYLSMFVDENQRNWDQLLPLFLLSYRTAQHEATKQTPGMMLMGRELKLPLDLLRGKPPHESFTTSTDFVVDLVTRMDKIHNFARQQIKLISDRTKARYDGRAPRVVYNPGQAVWLYQPVRRKGRCPKLQSDWEGPYRVIKRLSDVVYRIQRNPKTKAKVVHADRLAEYHDK